MILAVLAMLVVVAAVAVVVFDHLTSAQPNLNMMGRKTEFFLPSLHYIDF